MYQPRKRDRTTSIPHVAALLDNSKNVVVLVGAGISRSCGIPDFRSDNGIYQLVQQMDLGLPQPECIFDISYFLDDPVPFYKFAHVLYAKGDIEPSPTHFFLAKLEQLKKLRRVYTQNLDELEHKAGVTKVLNCHGILSQFQCIDCKLKSGHEEVKEAIDSCSVPLCRNLTKKDIVCGGTLRPMMTFFGEKINNRIQKQLARDCANADLLLVIGTSLQVSPMSGMPSMVPERTPTVLINQNSLSINFDYELVGSSDEICADLFNHLRNKKNRNKNSS